jgi:hypothetical protein
LVSLAVNGRRISPQVEQGYAVITRKWQVGDTVDLVLPLEVQRVKCDEKVAANRGLVALRYGPLIYNVERADQPDIGKAIGLAPLSTEWRGDLLQGVVAIKGQWADGSPLLAVPNYARNNRDSAGGRGPGTTGSDAEGGAPDRRGRRGGDSMVWIKDR